MPCQTLSRSRIALAILLLAGTVPLQGQAQTAAEDTVARMARAIDIRAQPLTDALNDWARQTGLQIIADQRLVAGLAAPAVSGQLSPLQALDRLLDGSGLRSRVEGQAVIIQAAPGSRSDKTLPTVNVRAATATESALGPVTGYVARRSTSATKADIPLIETAQAVDVVTAEEIAIQGSETLASSLRYTAGVSPMGGGLANTSDTLILRGFNVGFNPVYVNGSRLSRNTFMGTVKPYGVERVEVLKGPASVLHGTSAPGGTINIVTKQPQREASRELKLQLGTDSHRQLAGDITGSLNDSGTLTYRLTGLVRRSDTSVDHIPDDRDFFQASLRWQPSAATSLLVMAGYQNNATMYNYGLPAEGTVLPNPNGRIARGRFVGEPGFDKFQATNRTFLAQFSHRFNDTLTFRQNLLGFMGRANYTNIWAGSLDESQRRIARGVDQRTSANHSWSLDNQLEARWRSGAVEHTSLVGVDFAQVAYRLLSHSGSVGPLDLFTPVYGSPVSINAAPSQDYRNSGKQLGLYVQNHMKIDGRWVVSLSGRFDKFREDNDNHRTGIGQRSFNDDAFTGRLGLVRLFDNGWAPYASYAQSFEPASGETVSGEPFKPTQGNQVEVGVRYQPPGTAHSYRASVYQLTQTNVSTRDPDHPTFSIQVGEVRSRGVELEARANLANGLNLIASYGFTDNEVTKSNAGTLGRTYAVVPRHMAALWLDYQATDALTVGGGLRYLGRSRNLVNTVDVPAFRVVDAVASYRLTRQWQLGLNLTNLTDERYATCTYACFYGESRKLMATLAYRW